MKTPIINQLKKYKEAGAISFHTPGHKNRLDEDFKALLGDIDATELKMTDNIFSPKSIIKESQEEIARIYGSAYSFLNVGGSTTGNYIAMAGLSKPKDKVLVQRNSHKSIYNALVLSDLEPVYLENDYDENFEFATSIKAGAVEKAFEDHPDIKLVLITSPNYFGTVQDIKTIGEIVHSHGAKLIVDEAHGAHFKFLDEGPLSAIDLGADVVINSTHKNLPSLTQSSLIHVKNKEDLEDIRQAFNIYISTSPSFLLMASIEYAVAFMDDKGAAMQDELVAYVKGLKNTLADFDNINVYKYDPNFQDPLRLVLNIDGFSGRELSNILSYDYNIDIEMNDHKNIVVLFSPLTTKEDLDKLRLALVSIAKDKRRAIEPWDYYLDVKIPTRIYSPRQAFYMENEIINYKDSLGRVVADTITSYPPGIPLLSPGEQIDQTMIDLIDKLLEENIKIINLDEEKIRVLK